MFFWKAKKKENDPILYDSDEESNKSKKKSGFLAFRDRLKRILFRKKEAVDGEEKQFKDTHSDGEMRSISGSFTDDEKEISKFQKIKLSVVDFTHKIGSRLSNPFRKKKNKEDLEEESESSEGHNEYQHNYSNKAMNDFISMAMSSYHTSEDFVGPVDDQNDSEDEHSPAIQEIFESDDQEKLESKESKTVRMDKDQEQQEVTSFVEYDKENSDILSEIQAAFPNSDDDRSEGSDITEVELKESSEESVVEPPEVVEDGNVLTVEVVSEEVSVNLPEQSNPEDINNDSKQDGGDFETTKLVTTELHKDKLSADQASTLGVDTNGESNVSGKPNEQSLAKNAVEKAMSVSVTEDSVLETLIEKDTKSNNEGGDSMNPPEIETQIEESMEVEDEILEIVAEGNTNTKNVNICSVEDDADCEEIFEVNESDKIELTKENHLEEEFSQPEEGEAKGNKDKAKDAETETESVDEKVVTETPELVNNRIPSSEEVGSEEGVEEVSNLPVQKLNASDVAGHLAPTVLPTADVQQSQTKEEYPKAIKINGLSVEEAGVMDPVVEDPISQESVVVEDAIVDDSIKVDQLEEQPDVDQEEEISGAKLLETIENEAHSQDLESTLKVEEEDEIEIEDSIGNTTPPIKNSQDETSLLKKSAVQDDLMSNKDVDNVDGETVKEISAVQIEETLPVKSLIEKFESN